VALVARNVEITNHAVLVLAIASPYLLLVVPAAGVFYLVKRRWARAAGTAVVAVALLAILLPPPGSRPVENAAVVRVMSVNLLQGRADEAAVVQLASEHADVVAVQELTADALSRLSANGLDSQFSYRVAEPRTGAGLWSRYPIRYSAVGTEEFPITARVEVPGARTLPTVVVVHLSAPWPWTIEWWRTDIAQLAQTLKRIRHQANAVIVVGDFNSTSDMKQFRHVLDLGYDDADTRRLTPTYPAGSLVPPLVAVDHILTRNSSSSSPWTATIPGTDHRALIATVAIPK
jgi:endonuclease/exonuclease/phosphatase family metal-dependent hydrolase